MNRQDQKLIWEAYAGFRPVQSKYIYFVDSGEVYQTNPYKLITNDITKIDSAKIFPDNVKQVRVALGEDLNDLGIIKLAPEDFKTWYIVDNSVPQDHSHEAVITVK